MATVTIPAAAWVNAVQLLRQYQKLQHENGDMIGWRHVRGIADELEGK